MTDSIKRKSPPGGNAGHSCSKRSKGGSGGKWQTPHQRAKEEAHRRGGKIEPGDVGIWATCVKDKEGVATEELKALFDEYAGRFYGDDTALEKEDEKILDIESSIQKEVASVGFKEGLAKLFTPVFLDLPCVLFFKTRQPVEPVDFVHQICMDAAEKWTIRRHRFVNRLTPVTMTGKATEKGLEEVGRNVLREHFRLTEGEADQIGGEAADERKSSYAIRPTIRNHSTLTRDVVIKIVASIIGLNHKVDLTKPDKVIIVEIYQTICGMSVVGSDWEALKRFNLAEIHRCRALKESQPITGAANPKAATANEAHGKAGKADMARAAHE